MAHLIPASAIDRYQAAPGQTTVDAVKSLHTNIRDTLGTPCETLLQGSYKNDTVLADLNDVHIVAIRKNTASTFFTGIPLTNPVPWATIFDEVQRTLEASRYRGKTSKEDKCITVATAFKADVVPAIEIVGTYSDPISIYSRRASQERKNFPRIHYDNGVAKHKATLQRFKPTVRTKPFFQRQHRRSLVLYRVSHLQFCRYRVSSRSCRTLCQHRIDDHRPQL